MTLDLQQIRQLVPHTGSMCLLAEVIWWDSDSIECHAHSHRDPDNPLRGRENLSAVHAIEYAAQAMAVHGGLMAKERGIESFVGFVASVRDLTLNVSRLDNIESALRIRCQRLIANTNALVYRFNMVGDNKPLAGGRINIMTAGVGSKQ